MKDNLPLNGSGFRIPIVWQTGITDLFKFFDAFQVRKHYPGMMEEEWEEIIYMTTTLRYITESNVEFDGKDVTVKTELPEGREGLEVKFRVKTIVFREFSNGMSLIEAVEDLKNGLLGQWVSREFLPDIDVVRVVRDLDSNGYHDLREALFV